MCQEMGADLTTYGNQAADGVFYENLFTELGN